MRLNSDLRNIAILMFAILCTGTNGSAFEKGDYGEQTCSDRTIRSSYGFVLQGTLGAPGTLANGSGVPLRGIALTHFDGHGNLSQVDHVVVNGIPPTVEWTAGTGTYMVNADCTGSATIYSPSNPAGPLNIKFVIVKNGVEIDEVVDGGAVIATGKKVE